MQDLDRETLSQMMDGEWQDIDAASGIRAVADDKQMQDTWARYHLVRDVLRNEKISLDRSLASAISARLEDEPAYTNVASINDGQPVSGVAASTTETVTPNPWRVRLGGLAIAASVAAATVVGLNVWQGSAPLDENNSTLVAGAANNPSGFTGNATSLLNVPGVNSPQVSLVGNQGTYWTRSEPGRSAESEERLNMFLSQHIEHAPSAEWQGMLPYSRLVGYDEISANRP